MERLRFALLGHPVRQSVSPVMHGAALRALGLPHGYSAIDVPSEASLRRLVGEIRRGSFHGVNITLPYKQAVLEMVDEVAASAEEVGAANVLVRTTSGGVIAHNTDVSALAEEVLALTTGRPRQRAVVLGAGGAGLSAIAALRQLGFSVVAVTSHSWKGTEEVYESESGKSARRLGALTMPWPSDSRDKPTSGKASQVLRMQWSEFAAAADVIVQATSAGMRGGPPGEEVAKVVPWTLVRPGAVAYDVIYNPIETPFLREARSRGHEALGGLGMLVRQAAASLALWTGEQPSMEVMRAAAEQALAGP